MRAWHITKAHTCAGIAFLAGILGMTSRSYAQQRWNIPVQSEHATCIGGNGRAVWINADGVFGMDAGSTVYTFAGAVAPHMCIDGPGIAPPNCPSPVPTFSPPLLDGSSEIRVGSIDY